MRASSWRGVTRRASGGNLARIAELVDRMGGLTGQLKSFARKSSGLPQAVLLRRVVDNALFLLEQRIRRAGVAIRIELAREDLWVQAHAQRLEQVLVNLLSNAMKYSPEGGEIRWSVRPGRENGWVCLSVSDPGVGMTADEQSRLFTRFFRARTDIPGTGLGLVIVRELMERMGGHITVSSQPGVGTTFTLHLRTVSPWTF